MYVETSNTYRGDKTSCKAAYIIYNAKMHVKTLVCFFWGGMCVVVVVVINAWVGLSLMLLSSMSWRQIGTKQTPIQFA